MRASIRAQVERCAYVERVDAQLQSDPSAVCDSFRKHQWLQHRASKSRAPNEDATMEAQRHLVVDEQAAVALEAVSVQQQQTAAVMALSCDENEAAASAAAHSTGSGRDRSVPLAFESFLDEILESDVTVHCSQAPMPSKASDRLGAMSVPSRREGNSLTLCCYNFNAEIANGMTSSFCRTEQLVVFGGRVLQDVSRLLPAAVRKDSMAFERVRYTYSNGVYAYDIPTGVWRFRECGGRVPRERSDHSAVFVEPHYLVVVGGRGRNGHVFQDCFALNLQSWQWTLVDPEPRLVERYWHACCVTRESVVVFGGKSDVTTHGDLQLLSVSALCESLLPVSDAPSTSSTPLEWVYPHTVGKAPSPRFGMTAIALNGERIAVVGGHKAHKKKVKPPSGRRLMDVFILDMVTLIWSSPRLSSHLSTRTVAPTARMLFECFYHHHTLVVFGGYTYAANGESEARVPQLDSSALPVVYKLNVNRMIWRRQVLQAPTAKGCETTVYRLLTPRIHASSNAVLGTRAFTCASSEEHTLLDLVEFHFDTNTTEHDNEQC